SCPVSLWKVGSNSVCDPSPDQTSFHRRKPRCPAPGIVSRSASRPWPSRFRSGRIARTYRLKQTRRSVMRVLFAWISLALATVPFAAQDRGGNSDEGAIRDLVGRYVEARERVDPQSVAALFTPDADQLVSSGEWRKGRDEVVRGTMASSRNSGGHRSI